MTYGDGFKPHPLLEPYAKTINQTFYFDSGEDVDRAVLVLVHGNGDEADTWRHVFTPLSRSFRVLALDLPGFGRSKPLDNGNLKSLAAALSSFLEAVKLTRVHLVGSSLGANRPLVWLQIAQVSTQSNPGREDRAGAAVRTRRSAGRLDGNSAVDAGRAVARSPAPARRVEEAR